MFSWDPQLDIVYNVSSGPYRNVETYIVKGGRPVTLLTGTATCNPSSRNGLDGVFNGRINEIAAAGLLSFGLLKVGYLVRFETRLAILNTAKMSL